MFALRMRMREKRRAASGVARSRFHKQYIGLQVNHEVFV
jgi:hypothetical protein